MDDSASVGELVDPPDLESGALGRAGSTPATRTISINPNYKVDTEGNIYSKPRAGTKGGKLKPQVNTRGYLVVSLAPARQPKRVHRLVAAAFIPNPRNLPQVNHKDGDKTNNRVTNLEWCSAKSNTQHAVVNGLRKAARGSKHSASKLTDEQVEAIKVEYARGGITQRALGLKFGVSHAQISRVVNGVSYK